MTTRGQFDGRQGLSPKLAVRIAVLGGFALALFALVFFRLWFLQIISGDDYVGQAQANRVRKVKIEAPRGNIVDREGRILVESRIAPVIQITPSNLPASELAVANEYSKARSAAERERLAAKAQLKLVDREAHGHHRRTPKEQREHRALVKRAQRARHVKVPPYPHKERKLVALFHRLGRIVGMSPQEIHTRIVEGLADQPYANVTIKTDVPRDAFNYIKERQAEFVGVAAEKQYIRHYPHGKLAAQLFGTIRQISPNELKKKRYKGLNPGARIGKDGIEETYDHWLRGHDGAINLIVNSMGERDDQRPSQRVEPVQGQQLKLSLDLELQRAAHRAMETAIGAAKGNSAKAGAYVAIDPRNGEVLALGSYPSFDANVFAKPISQKKFDQLNSEANGAPLFNRAIAATYPTGSTFKPVTAMASLEGATITPNTVINDGGSFGVGGLSLHNAGGAAYGSLTLPRALQVSSDVFFYTLGARANARGPLLQQWARRLGFGHPTGIDLPGEFGGLVPDRHWRDAGFNRYLKCIKRKHVPIRSMQALTACGGIDRPWTVGDNVNLAVGQGDLQATPLQLATAYSAIATGGNVPRPHLGKQIEDGSGRVVEEIRKSHRIHLKFAKSHQQAIMQGLRLAAGSAGGTSYDVFAGFPKPVYGKTGTAERVGQADQSWYACYVPDPKRPIVVVVTVERGGFGAQTAAPAARLILAKWFGVEEKQDFKAGSSQTR